MKKRILYLVSAFLLLALAGCGGQKGKPGTYTAASDGMNGPVVVELTLDQEGTMTQLKIQADKETEGLGKAAAARLQSEIINRQSVLIDSVSGATVTSEAVFAAVSDALSQAGLKAEKMPPREAVQGASEEITTDVVIVGAGTSGTGATLAASLAGVKVTVLEKLDHVGGLGITGMGLLATESSLQEAAGQDVTTEDIFQYLIKYNHYRTNGPLMKAVLEKSGDTIDWLMENGIGLRLGLGIDQKAHLDYPKTYHMWTNSREDFPNLYSRLADEYGLDLRLNTRGIDLIQDASGTVTGVIAEKQEGGKLTVHAKAVILATGGFGGDAEMFEEKSQINFYNYFGLGNQGEGVKMAWKAGADELGSHVIQIHLGDISGSKTIFNRFGENLVSQVKDAPLLWVNKEGTRFVDEGVAYDNVIWGNAAYSAGGEYFSVFDQGNVETFINEGLELTGAYQMNGSGLMNPQGGNDTNIVIGKLPTLQEDLAALITQGDIAFKADSLEGLAAMTGMSAEKLEASVAQYNRAVETGRDDLFYKNPDYLKYPLKKGPYYAVKVSGSTYGSIGGVRINEETQALTEKGEPIPGLYVVGTDAGGMYDNSYPDLEGLTMAFAMNSGRIAGETAAANVSSDQ